MRFWTLCQLVPGINLIAFAMLIGRKLAGWAGVAATVTGMLLPSAIITTFLTAGFGLVQGSPAFKSILQGILPATAGLMFVVVVTLGRPLLKESRQAGRRSLLLSVSFIVTAAALISFLRVPVWLALLLAGVAGALVLAEPAPVATPADQAGPA